VNKENRTSTSNDLGTKNTQNKIKINPKLISNQNHCHESDFKSKLMIIKIILIQDFKYRPILISHHFQQWIFSWVPGFNIALLPFSLSLHGLFLNIG